LNLEEHSCFVGGDLVWARLKGYFKPWPTQKIRKSAIDISDSLNILLPLENHNNNVNSNIRTKTNEDIANEINIGSSDASLTQHTDNISIVKQETIDNDIVFPSTKNSIKKETSNNQWLSFFGEMTYECVPIEDLTPLSHIRCKSNFGKVIQVSHCTKLITLY
jgi:hypothetical protein